VGRGYSVRRLGWIENPKDVRGSGGGLFQAGSEEITLGERNIVHTMSMDFIRDTSGAER
jgi:hypothetical protein